MEKASSYSWRNLGEQKRSRDRRSRDAWEVRRALGDSTSSVPPHPTSNLALSCVFKADSLPHHHSFHPHIPLSTLHPCRLEGPHKPSWLHPRPLSKAPLKKSKCILYKNSQSHTDNLTLFKYVYSTLKNKQATGWYINKSNSAFSALELG